MTAKVKSIPYTIRKEGIVVKRDRLGIRAGDLDPLGFPAVGSPPQEIDIACRVATRPVDLECIGRTPLECPSRRIVEPWYIYLIINYIKS